MNAVRDTVLALIVLFLAPIIIIIGFMVGLWVVVLSPLIIVGVLLFMWLRKKRPIKDIHIPKKVTETLFKERKPIMIRWKNYRVPLTELVKGLLASVIVVPIMLVILAYLLIFVFPIWLTALSVVLILGICIGRRK